MSLSSPREELSVVFPNASVVSNLPTREQLADKLWSESCQEIRAEMPRLRAMFARHQKAIDEGRVYGRQNTLDMDDETKRYWQEWQVQRQVEKERRA
jgi:hypothetical protein